MKHLLSVLLLLCAAQVSAQKLTLQGKVRDAETGEPLPYASVYVNAGSGTLTNIEGDFRLSVGSQEVLTFSLVGYEKQKLKAGDVPKTVSLQPLARALKEVVVTPVDAQDVVKQVIDNLKKDFSKHKAEKQGYFMRTWMRNEWDSNLIECFMAALSAANLREGETLSGIYGMNAEGDSSKMGLYFTNIQKMTEIGPGAFMSDYWEAAIKPLYSHSMVRKYYDLELETLFGNEDEKLYRIVFKWKDKVRSEWHTRYLDERRHIIGTAYVDARTLRLLRFEGNVDNAYMLYNFQRYPNAIKFHASYDYADGFPAVSNLAIEGGNELLQYRLLMFNIQDDDLPYESSGQVGDNIIDVIENAGYDSTLWARFDIVKRTAEEERIAFGETLSEDSSDESLPEVTISPEQSEEANPQVERPVPFGKTIPQEMVFVHMDNTCYFLGDTLFYKAYVQRSDTGKPTDLSEVLYVELLGQDGYLVERQVLRLKDGQANGSFCLEDTLYAGFFELRAYTRWQLNFGRTVHPHDKFMHRWFLKKAYAEEYFRDYDKLYSRVFPVYDKPKAPGEYYRDMTVRPLRRDYAPEKISRKPKVSLFPEGGSLIEGVSQRVAFEAKDGEGQYVDGRLFVLNGGGDTLCTAVTENRGRGCMELCLQRDDRYRALFEEPGGETTKVSLPDILPSGAAMKVEEDGGYVKADIRMKGVEQDSVMMLVTTCGRPRMQIPFEGRLLTVSKDSLPAGVAQLTLIGKGGILADRLVFVHKPDLQKAPLQITGLKQSYEPLEQVSLKVQGKVNSTLSVSVRDNVSSDLIYDNGNIMTEMLLSSHIKGFVENPGYYFEADDSEHQRHLDLLLMVQGWRRFSINRPEIVEPYEKSQMIVGEVNKYTPLDQEDGFYLQENSIRATLECPIPLWIQWQADSVAGRNSTSRFGETYDVEFLSEPGKPTHLHTEFVQPGFAPVYGDMTVKENGKFSFAAPHFGGYCLLHLAASSPEKLAKADKKEKKKKAKQTETSKGNGWQADHQWLMPSADESAEYSIRVHRCYPHFVKPYEYFQQQLMPDEGNAPEPVKSDGMTNLREVKVKARRRILRKVDLTKPAVVMDAYDAYNQLVDAGLTSAFFAGSWSFSDILCRLLVGDMGQQRGNISASRRWDGRTIYVNSIQVKEEQLKYNHLENLDKVYVYTDYSPRKEGSSQFYGSNQPEVVVDLHRFLDDAKRVTYRDRFIVLDGYNTSAEFYSPDYSQQTPPEPTDYRRTLYWNPNLQLGENGEATVTFYNNSRQTTLSVEAEGQAPDGTLLWNR
ncbi:MAG: carboxypeptidase-like regulatory domain-containing protein [Bacteroidaceae bacterium]|nr:carboxypeptidase-like regulatory domain-containing protein [Bacteroidaceae bacterium]